MKIFDQTDRRFIGLEIKTGLFALVAVAIVAALGVFVAFRGGYFTPKTDIHFITDTGEGIFIGMPAKLSGFTIGKVTATELVDNPVDYAEGGKVRASLSIKVTASIITENMKWIKRDSKAILRKENVIGDQIIDILPGSVSSAPVRQGEFIKFERERNITDYVAEITSAIEEVKARATAFINYVNDPKGDIKLAIVEVKRFWSDVHQTREKLSTLLTNLDRRIDEVSHNAETLTEKASSAFGKLDRAAEITTESAPEIIDKVNVSLDKLSRVLDDMKKLTAALSEKAPGLMDRGEELSESAESLTDSVKRMWPVRNYVREHEKKTLPMDSHE